VLTGFIKVYGQSGAIADDCRGPLTTTPKAQGRVWRGSPFDDGGGLYPSANASAEKNNSLRTFFQQASP